MAQSPVWRAIAVGCLTASALVAACTPAPTPPTPFGISSILPVRGPDSGSTAVQIYGYAFTADVVVRIDGTVVTPVRVGSTSIDVIMPAHARGFVDFTLTNAANASSTLAHAFEYTHLDPPVVTDLTPSTGSPDGYNMVKITGTGFELGTVVTIDGRLAEIVPFGPSRTSTFINVWAPAHAVGSVELAVKNTDGQTHRVPYTYAPSETFDFNGVWTGFVWETDNVMSLTIRNNELVSVTCGAVTHTFSQTVVVSQGRFSVSGPDVSMTGQVLSPVESTGTLTIPGCLSSWGWQAFK
jgi:hypothetical protein